MGSLFILFHATLAADILLTILFAGLYFLIGLNLYELNNISQAELMSVMSIITIQFICQVLRFYFVANRKYMRHMKISIILSYLIIGMSISLMVLMVDDWVTILPIVSVVHSIIYLITMIAIMTQPADTTPLMNESSNVSSTIVTTHSGDHNQVSVECESRNLRVF